MSRVLSIINISSLQPIDFFSVSLSYVLAGMAQIQRWPKTAKKSLSTQVGATAASKCWQVEITIYGSCDAEFDFWRSTSHINIDILSGQ